MIQAPKLATENYNSNINLNTKSRSLISVGLGDGTGNITQNLHPRNYMDKLIKWVMFWND